MRGYSEGRLGPHGKRSYPRINHNGTKRRRNPALEPTDNSPSAGATIISEA